MQAQILDIGVVCNQVTHGLGEQNLSAVACCTDAGGTVDIKADISTTLDGRFARVQTNPDPQRRTLRPWMDGKCPLDSDGRSHAVSCPAEGREELVGSAVDLVAATRRDDTANQPPVLQQNGTVPLPQLAHQPRRPLNIREQQSDGPAGKLVHIDLPTKLLLHAPERSDAGLVACWLLVPTL